MKAFVQDIEDHTVANEMSRRVLYMTKQCRLVLMALKPKEEIGEEVNALDQFFRVEKGTGEAVLDGVRSSIEAGFVMVVPAGTTHNITNTGSDPMKLYTFHAPRNRRDGRRLAEAEVSNQHVEEKGSNYVAIGRHPEEGQRRGAAAPPEREELASPDSRANSKSAPGQPQQNRALVGNMRRISKER